MTEDKSESQEKIPLSPERKAEIELFLERWLAKNIGTKPPTIN